MNQATMRGRKARQPVAWSIDGRLHKREAVPVLLHRARDKTLRNRTRKVGRAHLCRQKQDRPL